MTLVILFLFSKSTAFCNNNNKLYNFEEKKNKRQFKNTEKVWYKSGKHVSLETVQELSLLYKLLLLFN